jgi:hypothetical protein
MNINRNQNLNKSKGEERKSIKRHPGKDLGNNKTKRRKR